MQLSMLIICKHGKTVCDSCLQGGARRMLKQLRGKTSDQTLDDISPDDEFSDLGVLDDSNSMYMVRSPNLLSDQAFLQCKLGSNWEQAAQHLEANVAVSLSWLRAVYVKVEACVQVVGFEVMACSIRRKAGARVEALSCVGNDDRPPEPQEVVKGTAFTLWHLCSKCRPSLIPHE